MIEQIEITLKPKSRGFHLVTSEIIQQLPKLPKTGIQGLAILTVPMLAMTFGAKPSTGLMLPVLCFADVIGVSYYRPAYPRRHCVRG